MPNLIKMKAPVSSVSNSILVSQLTPKMVIVVRDTDINLNEDGEEKSTKEYLER